VVTQALAIRPCAQRDLERFRALGSEHHVKCCREEFGRGLYFKYLGTPVPNPGVWMRKEVEC
jgi:hypothetical protein